MEAAALGLREAQKLQVGCCGQITPEDRLEASSGYTHSPFAIGGERKGKAEHSATLDLLKRDNG